MIENGLLSLEFCVSQPLRRPQRLLRANDAQVPVARDACAARAPVPRERLCRASAYAARAPVARERLWRVSVFGARAPLARQRLL